MKKRCNLTKKQRARLITGAKIRKQTKAWLLNKLNDGESYKRGTTFFHAQKGDIEGAQQPSRYRGIASARRV